MYQQVLVIAGANMLKQEIVFLIIIRGGVPGNAEVVWIAVVCLVECSKTCSVKKKARADP